MPKKEEPLVNVTYVKTWEPFVGPFDPCPPILVKSYVTPPNLYIGFQPPGQPQYSPMVALRQGTLWPLLDDHYMNLPGKGGSAHA
jgi:spore coat protein JA